MVAYDLRINRGQVFRSTSNYITFELTFQKGNIRITLLKAEVSLQNYFNNFNLKKTVIAQRNTHHTVSTLVKVYLP